MAWAKEDRLSTDLGWAHHGGSAGGHDRCMDIPTELLQLAARQDDLVTRRQALDTGMTDAAIRHLVGKYGGWQRVVSGVYATFTGKLLQRHHIRAALLYTGPEAVLTGSHACRGYAMQYAPESGVPELLVPPHIKRAKISIAKIRRVTSMPTARTVHGVPCAPPERAALDAARGAKSLRDARATLCEVVQRGLTTVDRLVDEYNKIDRRGMRHAQRATSDIRAGCRSAPECEARDLMLTSDILPEVCWNQPLPDADDLVPDAYLKEARLVVEIESMEFHQFGEAPELTERRRARYASLGWRVIPISPRRIREEPQAVLADIEAAFTSAVMPEAA
jgi:hypothetical protein